MIGVDSDGTYNFQYKFETLLSFGKIIRLLQDSTFIKMWPYIFGTTFGFVSSSQAKDYIENAGRIEQEESINSTINSQSEESKIDDDVEAENNAVYQELFIQKSFDLFSYLSSRVSCDSDSIGKTPQEFIAQILDNIESINGWREVNWVKFLLTCVICNGGGLQNNVNMDQEEDFQSRLMRLMMDELTEKEF